MAEENLERARKVYKTLCATLDSHSWKFTGDEEHLCIECGVQGEDLPMEVRIEVNSNAQLIVLLSRLPFVVSEEKRLDVAIATSIVNDRLVDGSFDYNITKGRMFFRMTSSFIESEIGNEMFTYMLMCSCSTIDAYNDKFLMLSKGMIGIEKFISDK